MAMEKGEAHTNLHLASESKHNVPFAFPLDPWDHMQSQRFCVCLFSKKEAWRVQCSGCALPESAIHWTSLVFPHPILRKNIPSSPFFWPPTWNVEGLRTTPVISNWFIEGQCQCQGFDMVSTSFGVSTQKFAFSRVFFEEGPHWWQQSKFRGKRKSCPSHTSKCQTVLIAIIKID